MFETLVQSTARLFNDGGPFMWPILLFAALAVAVVIERIIFYFVICRTNGSAVVAGAARALNSDDVAGARAAICRRKSPLNALLCVALDRYGDGLAFNEIQEGVEERAIQELPRMTERLNYLSLLANVSTLLGLLGTIAGLQIAFTSLASVEAAKKATMLAVGISQAMLTTAFGLIVAVPCMIAYTLLFNKQQRLTRDLDEAVVRFLNFLKKKRPPQ